MSPRVAEGITTGIETGAKELALETTKSNVTARHLYEGQGRERDGIFYRYNLSV